MSGPGATILAAFGPVFLMIALGWGARASGHLPHTLWAGVNALNYRLLLPAILFTTLLSADLSTSGAATVAAASATGSILMAALALGVARLLGAPHSAAAPLVGVATLWNVVLVMAVSARLIGPEADDALAAAVAAGVITGTLLVVALFAYAGRQGAVRRIAADPVVLATLAGVLASMSGISPPTVILDALGSLGAGALAVILLSIGAGLDFATLRGRLAVLASGALMRSLVGPAVFTALGFSFGLSGPALAVMMLAGAAPGAAYLYAMTAEFKGETGLAAGMITLSVIFSAVTMPLIALAALAR